MKISELTPVASPRRDLILPLAVVDENGDALGNGNVSLGQIIDSVPKSIVPFDEVKSAPANTVVANTAAPPLGKVVYDTTTQKFYSSAVSVDLAGGTATTTYYTSWNGSGNFQDSNGNIRKDCLFRDKNGRLYFYDGETLKIAGGQKTVFISTEDYDALENPDPDTIYYIYED